MAYFPLFQDLAGRPVLIVGGGHVALRKAQKLLPFGPNITVVAPHILPEFTELSLTQETREFRAEDITPALFCVIAASGSREVNRQVCQLCGKYAIPVNSVDDPSLCTFLFPSLVQRGPLTVGITTSGSSPTAAIWVREAMEQLLPDSLDEILLWLGAQRELIKSSISSQAMRTACQRSLFAACMAAAAPLGDETRDEIIHQYQTQQES